jgi:hypothetical protein
MAVFEEPDAPAVRYALLPSNRTNLQANLLCVSKTFGVSHRLVERLAQGCQALGRASAEAMNNRPSSPVIDRIGNRI